MLPLVSDLVGEIRAACAAAAGRARYVSIEHDAIAPYAVGLPLGQPPAPGSDPHLTAGTREDRAAFWLTLDAINFGSGWFPTLRKRPGASGYATVAAGIRDRFSAAGPWRASELASIEAAALAKALGQDPDHELMALFAASLRDLGTHVESEYAGSFAAVADAAAGSAVALATLLSGWSSFADSSPYADIEVPFFKRAQIAAADLHRGGAARFADLSRLTMFADNLVPHVLRLDGVLRFDPDLVARIDRAGADRPRLSRGGRDPGLRAPRRRTARRRSAGQLCRRHRPAAVEPRPAAPLQGLAPPPVALHGLLSAIRLPACPTSHGP